MIIAIDGHSSCGKSTLAKEIAENYAYTYVDTGAMYRAVTYFVISQENITPKDINSVILKGINIEFRVVSGGQKHLFLNGKDVENEIRSMEVANRVSEISQIKLVRDEMVFLQRKMADLGNLVLDGRDIGTVVFPKAEVKIFLTARPEVRAQRRFDEMKEKGIEVNYQDVLDNVLTRDYQDENREESPLRQADDAIRIDNSDLSREEQFQKVLGLIDDVGK